MCVPPNCSFFDPQAAVAGKAGSILFRPELDLKALFSGLREAYRLWMDGLGELYFGQAFAVCHAVLCMGFAVQLGLFPGEMRCAVGAAVFGWIYFVVLFPFFSSCFFFFFFSSFFSWVLWFLQFKDTASTGSVALPVI